MDVRVILRRNDEGSASCAQEADPSQAQDDMDFLQALKLLGRGTESRLPASLRWLRSEFGVFP